MFRDSTPDTDTSQTNCCIGKLQFAIISRWQNTDNDQRKSTIQPIGVIIIVPRILISKVFTGTERPGCFRCFHTDVHSLHSNKDSRIGERWMEFIVLYIDKAIAISTMLLVSEACTLAVLGVNWLYLQHISSCTWKQSWIRRIFCYIRGSRKRL